MEDVRQKHLAFTALAYICTSNFTEGGCVRSSESKGHKVDIDQGEGNNIQTSHLRCQLSNICFIDDKFTHTRTGI